MPRTATREVMEFNDAMTREFYQELLDAIEAAAPAAAPLVSLTYAPSLDDHGWEYMSSRLAGLSPQDSPKVWSTKGLACNS